MILTKGESELLLHRLEIADCIAEALAGCVSTAEAIQESANQLARKVRANSLKIENLLALDKLVLREACEGSTYCAAVAHEPRRAAGARRVAFCLEAKLALRGLSVHIPRD